MDGQCERCFGDLAVGRHGYLRCPFEPRPYDGFHTPKDKLFEFTTTFVKPGTQIRTKGQWNQFCKQHNYVEIPMKERMDMVSHGFAERKRQERVETLRQTARKVFGEALPSIR